MGCKCAKLPRGDMPHDPVDKSLHLQRRHTQGNPAAGLSHEATSPVAKKFKVSDKVLDSSEATKRAEAEKARAHALERARARAELRRREDIDEAEHADVLAQLRERRAAGEG